MLRFQGFFHETSRHTVAAPRSLPEALRLPGKIRSLSGSTWPTVHSISLQPSLCITSRPNDSLGAGGRRRILLALGAGSLSLALVFVALGAWPVLPYSAIEVAALFAAFWCIGRHAGDWESLRVEGDRIVVERACAGVVTREEFNRSWTRLDLERGMRGTRLALSSAGKRVCIGANLNAEERAYIARELRRALAAR
jgi:uncharacterized membrane protein